MSTVNSPPPTSPLPSPPDASTVGDDEIVADPLVLPKTLVAESQSKVEIIDPSLSRFPVLRNLLPIGRLSRHSTGDMIK